MEIRLPQLGEGADSGSVATILVKEGDTIQENDLIIELESEKAVAPIPSPAGGVISKIHVNLGDTVKVGQVLLTLSDDASGATDKVTTPQAESAAPAAPAAPATAPTPQPLPPPGSHPPAAAPSVRRLAQRIGVDLTQVRGSERGGRITIADVRAYVVQLQELAHHNQATPQPTLAPPASGALTDFAAWGEVSRQPMTPLRRTIARRMHESWSAIPHVTQFDEADLTALLALRKKLAPDHETEGVRLTLTPLILKALVRTLQHHPLLNASLDDTTNEIVLKEYYHIGIAVDTDHGLIVPVLRDVDRKPLLQLSRDLVELADKAKERKLKPEELKGGTFTISNQGGIGSGSFTPIVNQPEVAILGLGRGTMKPVVSADQTILPRMMLPLCLSYDHRVIDGANAARFVVDLVKALEDVDAQDLDTSQ